ncbi:hypothetical protein D3C87_2186580 [compost metagenome]
MKLQQNPAALRILMNIKKKLLYQAMLRENTIVQCIVKAKNYMTKRVTALCVEWI